MSFFNSIVNFFKKLFGKDGATVQTILTDINKLYVQAQPIVAALSAAVSIQDALNPSQATKKIQGVLEVFVKDSALVDQWVTKNSGLSLATVLSNAAVLALSSVSGVGIAKDLQLAVQLAYSVYSALNPQTTGNTVASNLGKAVK